MDKKGTTALKNGKKLRFLAFVLLSAIAMPTFDSQFGSAGVILVNGSLIVILATYLLLRNGQSIKMQSKRGKAIAFQYITPIALMIILVQISMFVGLVFGDVNIIVRDFFELYRPILYALTFVFAFQYFSVRWAVVHLERLLVAVFLIVLIFGLNQFFNISESVSVLYTKKHNILSGRIATPFNNPYDYAFFITFFVYYFFIKSLYGRFWYIPLFFLSVGLLILPQSRSVIAGFAIGFAVIMPILLSYLGINLKALRNNTAIIRLYGYFLALTLSLISLLPYLIDSFPYLTGQFIIVLDGGGIGNSANVRLSQFLFALDKAERNFIILVFGNGPAKDEMEFVESLYTYLFYRYGVLGLILNLAVLGLSMFHCFKIVLKVGPRSKLYELYLSILLWLLTIPIMSIGNNFTDQARISFFYYMILGLVAVSYYRIVVRGDKS